MKMGSIKAMLAMTKQVLLMQSTDQASPALGSLSARGIQVETACSAQDAILHAMDRSYDAFVLDWDAVRAWNPQRMLERLRLLQPNSKVFLMMSRRSCKDGVPQDDASVRAVEAADVAAQLEKSITLK